MNKLFSSMRTDKMITTIVSAGIGFIVARFPAVADLATPEMQTALAGLIAGVLNWLLSLLLHKFPWLKSFLSLGEA